MLLNPFTPAEIAASPDQFFGRESELKAIESSLPVGSVLIQGPIGIGKSSLLARALDMMTGVGSSRHCDVTTCVMHAEVTTAEAAALVVLDGLSEIDTGNKKVKLKFGLKISLTGMEPVAEYDSGDIVRDYQEGRHLAALMRCLERDHKRRHQQNRELLVIGIDEGDKAPVAVARLVRAVTTHLQQAGVRDVRFLLAGVSPLHQQMVQEDPGVARAFNRVITLAPMSEDERDELLTAKIRLVLSAAEREGIELNVDPVVFERIGDLSGGHPHVLQLLGSHMIEHENTDPDGSLNLGDLVGSLRRVCYEDRGPTYVATLHMLEHAGQLDALSTILAVATDYEFPTRIDREKAVAATSGATTQWLVEHNVLVPRSPHEYGLVDEFLRVRMAMDAEEKPELTIEVERQLMEQGILLSWDEIQELYGHSDDGLG